MTIGLHRLDADNAGLLANIAPEVFDHQIKREYLAAFLKDPRHMMFIATDGPMVVGIA